jgi:hypothetical protein
MRLIPLKCPQCGAKLKVTEDDVLTLCRHCGLACEMSEDSVIKLEQSLVLCQGRPDKRLPFWLLSGQIEVSRLEPRAVQNIFLSQPELVAAAPKVDRENLSLPGRVVVAAFAANNFVNYTADLSHELTVRLEERLPLGPVEGGVDYRTCRYGHRDARGMAVVLLTLLANRSRRQIMDLDLDVRWGDSRILWWPFAGDGDCWRDMIYGQRLLQSALPEQQKP